MSTSTCRFDHPRCVCWCWLLACPELASPRSKTPVVANFIQDAMDGPLGAKQTELANDVSRCAETLASPVLDEGHHHRFLLWCQLRLATTIAVCMRCNASVAELCLALLHVDALRSKLKGSLAWPTTSWCKGKCSSRLNQKLQIKPREATMLRMSQNFPSRPELLRARRKVWDIPTTLLCRHGSSDSDDLREWTCHTTVTHPVGVSARPCPT